MKINKVLSQAWTFLLPCMSFVPNDKLSVTSVWASRVSEASQVSRPTDSVKQKKQPSGSDKKFQAQVFSTLHQTLLLCAARQGLC